MGGRIESEAVPPTSATLSHNMTSSLSPSTIDLAFWVRWSLSHRRLPIFEDRITTICHPKYRSTDRHFQCARCQHIKAAYAYFVWCTRQLTSLSLFNLPSYVNFFIDVRQCSSKSPSHRNSAQNVNAFSSTDDISFAHIAKAKNTTYSVGREFCNQWHQSNDHFVRDL